MSSLSELVVRNRETEAKVLGFVVASEESKKVAVGLLKLCAKDVEDVKALKGDEGARLLPKAERLFNFIEKQIKDFDERVAAAKKAQEEQDKRIAKQKKELTDRTEASKADKAKRRKAGK